MAVVIVKVQNLIIKDRRLTALQTAEKDEIGAVSLHAVLCDHVQNGREICSQASVRGTEETLPCGCTGPNGHYQR
ncbi:hypothetical protein TNCV_3311441 [Trichonephila clavipes]|nr:hypothetical protein TNCV_3311441 [Trichonephila clavipes]